MTLKRHYQIIVIDLLAMVIVNILNVKLHDMPEIINMIFRKENINKAHFIGISEGAEIVQAFAQIFPRKVISLVGVSTISIFHDSYKALKSALLFTKIKLGFWRIFNFKKYKKWFIERSSYSIEGQELFKRSMRGFKRRSKNVKKGYNRFYN